MTKTNVAVPNDIRSLVDEASEPAAPLPTSEVWTKRLLALARISIGWVFLWAFLDKMFGLGFATESENAWIDGGSPTEGFLSFATKGPLADFYQSFAGDAWADWLFMIGLLGIGVALMAGIGMRVACASGALMLVMMWSAVLAPENNPFMDDHLVYAIVLAALAVGNAGDTWGFGSAWRRLPFVRRNPILI